MKDVVSLWGRRARFMAAFFVTAFVVAEARATELDSPYGFVLSYSKAWSETEAPSGVRFTAHYLKNASSGAYIWIKVSDKGQLDSAAGDGVAYLQDRFRLFTPSVLELGGLKWVTFELGAAGKTERIYTRLENGRIYSFNCGLPGEPAELAQSSMAAIKEILSTVRFQSPRAIPTPKASAEPRASGSAADSKAPPSSADPGPGKVEDPGRMPKDDPAPEAGGAPGADPLEKPAEPRAETPAPGPGPGPGPGGSEPPVEPETGPGPKDPAPEKLEPVEPEPRAGGAAEGGAGSGAVGAPVVRNALSASYGAELISRSSEYDPSRFSAWNLLRGVSGEVWRSAAGARGPHRFVFAFQSEVEITGIEVINAPVDDALPGIAARVLRLECSKEGPDGPWEALRRVEVAESGESAFAVPARRFRWLRVEIESNFGHPTVTQLAGIRALTRDELRESGPKVRELEPGAPSFELRELRLTKEPNGVDSGLEHSAGERVYICFKPRNMRLNTAGEYSLSVDLSVLGADERVIARKPKLVETVAELPQAPLVPYVSLRLDLPKALPPGAYQLQLEIQDGFSGRIIKRVLGLRVLPAEAR